MEDSPYLFELGKGEQPLNSAIFRVREYMEKRSMDVLFETATFVSFMDMEDSNLVYVYMFKNNSGQPGYIQISIDSANSLAEEAMVSKLAKIVKGEK